MKMTETKEGLLIEISVKPGSKEFRISVEADEIVVFCREQPTKGKANKELVKELSRLFHREVKLVSGLTSRQKRLLIKGAEASETEQVLMRK
jgi:uncharacterized protein (TIGR00251 family)